MECLALVSLLLQLLLTAPVPSQAEFGPCYRPCSANEKPRVCEFVFVEELYPTCSSACRNCTRGVVGDCGLPQCVCPDGIERTVIVINRQLPSPSIQVCKNDIIKVKLIVKTQGHGESIHWHGMPQTKTPWMDGVALVTQCPVSYGQTFEYEFVAEVSGTYFHHPHYGINKAYVVAGALIVRVPKSHDLHRALYDFDLAEHVVVCSDYMHLSPEFIFPGLRTRVVGEPNNNIVLNGKGNHRNSPGNVTRTPLTQIVVSPGKRYRLRFVGATVLPCPISIQIQGHELLLISIDGMDIKPVALDTIILFAGERVDVVINANHTEGSLFWIYATTAFGICTNNAVDQRAVLRYSSKLRGKSSRVTSTLPRSTAPTLANRRRVLPPRRVFNDPAHGCGPGSLVTSSAPGALCVAQLQALLPPHFNTERSARAQVTVVLGVKFHVYTNQELYNTNTNHKFIALGDLQVAGTIRNISFEAAPSPLLTQYEDALPFVCGQGKLPSKRGCNSSFCECMNVYKLPMHKLVDIVIVDSTTLPPNATAASTLAHPMHLHGYSYAVRSQGSFIHILGGEERLRHVANLHHHNRLPVPSPSPPLKDTVTLLPGGYVVIRIFTDNPGVWFFHCHLDFHMASGMEMAFQVGEPKDFRKAPHGFPKCGNFFNPPLKNSTSPPPTQPRG